MIDLKRTLELVKGALFDSEATWHSYLPEAHDWKKTAFLLTGPLIIASVVLAYLIALTGSDMSAFGIRPTLLSSLLNIIASAVSAAVVAFIFSTIAGSFGGKSDPALGLAATTLAFVPGYFGQALGWLPWIGFLVAIGLFIYSLVLLWRILPLYLEVPAEKRTVHFVVSLIASVVVMFILGAVVNRVLYGSIAGPAAQVSTSSIGGSGVFGDVTRRAELIAAAQEDRYSPPEDGELTERQVKEFIRVLDRVSVLQEEKAEQMKKLAEKADKDETLSMSELGQMMSSATAVSGIHTIELEVVKTAGGNWAEHVWVRDALRTAWLQKDINDAVEHNYELFMEYEDELQDYIVQ